MKKKLKKSDEPSHITDAVRIHFLETVNAAKFYSGRCILRWSNSERGWRLHETVANEPNFATVREAIDHAMKSEEFSLRLEGKEEMSEIKAPVVCDRAAVYVRRDNPNLNYGRTGLVRRWPHPPPRWLFIPHGWREAALMVQPEDVYLP